MLKAFVMHHSKNDGSKKGKEWRLFATDFSGDFN